MSEPPNDADTRNPVTPAPPPTESPARAAAARAKAERAARLAAALRDNLRRRKAPRAAASPRDRN